MQCQNPLAQPEFIVGEAAVFSAKNHRVGGISGQQPLDRCIGGLQRYESMIQTATGGNHPLAITDGGLEIGMNGCLPQDRGCMDGHPQRLITENLATGIDQTQ